MNTIHQTHETLTLWSSMALKLQMCMKRATNYGSSVITMWMKSCCQCVTQD